MFSIARQANRCSYCAFRSQQLQQQAQRQRSNGAARRISSDTRGAGRVKGERSYRGKRRETRVNDGGREDGSDSKIRKFLTGGEDSSKNPARARVAREREKKNFDDTLPERLKAMKEELKFAPILEHMRKEKEEQGGEFEDFGKIWTKFQRGLSRQGVEFQGLVDQDKVDSDNVQASPMKGLRQAYQLRGSGGLDDRIKYAFYEHVLGSRFTKSDIKNQAALADLRYPIEWFPATRSMKRTIHLHIGPTNSGKTYHALQRLEQAKSGIYAGPLRLLAHEVFTRMNAKGKACSLLTGEERRLGPDGSMGDMAACTVEMMPLNRSLNVAVIDEIQMIGDRERGWAWTQALLGVKAAEVHLCGEERTLDIVRELCASMGEKLEVHRYERLSPLRVADRSLEGSLKRLRKGDCIVSFSVMGIHALRRQIEKETGRKVATVYGSLPPETRAQQARLFNDPDNEYDYLVASDAVGMGLNLAIKRIIFESASKFDGYQRRTLAVADIKQIGGRAGRYRTAHQANEAATAEQELSAAKGETSLDARPPKPQQQTEENVGYVTTLERFDFPVISAAMESQPEPIRTAGLFPPAPVLERFASYFPPGTPFSFILTRLHELSQTHKRFHLCGLKDQIWIADLIEPVPNLTITDRNIIVSAPASKSDMDLWRFLMPALSRCIAEQSGGSLVDIEELPLETLEEEISASRTYLRELERLHKGIVTYLWLSYRFAGVFPTRSLAFHAKAMVEERIEEVLDKFSFTEAQRRKIAEKRAKQVREISDIIPVLDAEGNHVIDEHGYPMYKRQSEGEIAPGLRSERKSGLPEAKEQLEEEEEEVEDEDEEDHLDRTGQYLASHQQSHSAVHFGGEDDVETLEPKVEDADKSAEASPVYGSFAEWRAQQTRGENQGSREPDEEESSVAVDEIASMIQESIPLIPEQPTAQAEEEKEAPGQLQEHLAPPAELANPQTSVEEPTTVTPETEVKGDEAPLISQVASPNPAMDGAQSREEEVERVATPTPTPSPERSEGGGGSGVTTGAPWKHLEQLDEQAKESGRGAAGRP